MSITAAQLIAKVGVEGSDKAKADLQSVGGAVTSAGGLFKSALGGPISLVAGVAGKAFGFLKSQLEDSIKLAMDHQSIMAQTAQAIKSTGDASGMSASQIDEMATSLSKVTPFSKDTIQSGQNLLLTFTGIGKQAFPLATKAMIDLSRAMGQDMKSSAIQLGKAINDPLTGMSALQRVGVTFSATEKEQIKTAMAHNDILGAQKVMLKELNTEFGGSAQAAGKTLAGALAILKNNFNDLKEKVGSAVIPIFSNLVGMINTDVMPLFDKLGPVIGGVVSYFKSFDLGAITYQWHQLVITIEDILDPLNKGKANFSALSPILTTLRNDFSMLLVSGIKNIAGFIGTIATTIKDISNGQGPAYITNLSSGFREFMPLVQRVGQLMGGELMREFRDIGAAAQQVGQWFMSSVVPAIRAAMPGFESLARVILTSVIPAMIQIRGAVVDVIEHAFKIFGPIIEQMVPPLIRFAGLLAGDVANGLKFIMPYVKQAATELGKFADEIMTRVAPIIKNWIAQTVQVLDFFKAHWSQIWGAVGPILKGVWDGIVGIVKVAWSVVSGIIKIGLDIMSGNWRGAWNDFKSMLSGAWEGIKGIIKGGLEIINGMFAGMPGKALAWGEDMISGFIQGIENMLGGIGNAASQVASAISSHLHFSKPEIGPLANVDTWMPDFTDMLSKGLLAGVPKLKNAVAQIALPISASLNPTSTGSFSGGTRGVQFASPGNSSPPLHITVLPAPINIDGRVLASNQVPYIVDAIRYGVGTKI